MSEREEILALLRKRWEENPEVSFGYLVAQMTYAGVGHTEIGIVTNVEILDGLRRGWYTLTTKES